MPKRSSSKKKSAGGATASFAPDQMIQAGLADDFDGAISAIYYCPWDYNGNLDHFILAVAVEIEPDEGEGVDPFTQFYSAGDLKNWVPSTDGADPAGLTIEQYLQAAQGKLDLDPDELEECRGTFAVQVGKQQGLPNNSNFAFFVTQLGLARFTDWSDDLGTLAGLRAHFNRIPGPARKGLQGGDEGKRGDILVVTEILGKAKSKKSAKAETSDDDEDGIEEQVRDLIVGLLEEADGKPVTRRAITKAVRGEFKGRDLSAAMKLVKDEGWLSESDAWEYDEDEEELALVGAGGEDEDEDDEDEGDEE